MAYRFAEQKAVTELNKWCREILYDVQKEVAEYFTFDIRLIGSGDKRLVTQNADEAFDLDYNLILQKDKKGLLDNPRQIKEIFIARFNKVLNDYITNCYHTSDSTSVITVKNIRKGKLLFSFDVAIIVEGNDGCFYRLTNDKVSGRYIWNRVKNSVDYFEKYQQIKEKGLFPKFKQRYLDLKNMHLSRQDGVKSFSIFLETLNEVYR